MRGVGHWYEISPNVRDTAGTRGKVVTGSTSERCIQRDKAMRRQEELARGEDKRRDGEQTTPSRRLLILQNHTRVTGQC